MQHKTQNDETLVMLTLAGEQSAYGILVERHQKAVVQAAASVTHNLFMAEDAAQDAFVTAWMKLDILEEPQKFAAWVCRIARNCALNMVMRYRSFLPLETVENRNLADGQNRDPAELYLLEEERDELRHRVGSLPEKVGKVIELHYFQGLSVAEIADRMRISVGTVKWQLHDGRKRIRKGLCAMDEKYGDTLVQRVMKKVEELKLWQIRASKDGFCAVYGDVLGEVEKLPESGDKYHALADVLMRGWWWLPGEKNDALFARIKEAAQLGHNDEVMEFIVTREDSLVYEGGRLDFIREKQIPMLEKAGFPRTLGREWFWLGYQYFREKQAEKGEEAYGKVRETLKPSDLYYALVPYAREMEQKLSEGYREKSGKQYRLSASAAELRYIDGVPRYWKQEKIVEGHLNSADLGVDDIFLNSALCDSYFWKEGLALGETYTGSDGTTLTFVSDCEKVQAAGKTFNNCQLWATRHFSDQGCSIYRSYYKEGVGIVRHEHKLDGLTDVRILKSYRIAGGEGLLPMAAGNVWEYAGEYAPDVMHANLRFQVSHADGKSAVLASGHEIERLKYDEDSWLDMIQQIRNEYWREEGGREVLCDMSHAIERAETLASTPMEKAHTRAACSVARRILETSPMRPGNAATGHWNFFVKSSVQRKKDVLTMGHDFRWSFEWKYTMGDEVWDAEEPLLYNDIYGILQDAVNGIWSDEWKVGASSLVEYARWENSSVKTRIDCQDGGRIATKAGTFENCLKISLDIQGFDEGLSYRGGKKTYYFAEGVGIVRTENEYCDGERKAVYELTAYQGTGEGYMPMADGMMRRYDAMGLTDGFVGAAEYTYVQDDEGQITIFEDRIGIRETVPITKYGAIWGEIEEDRLWEEGKHEESRLRHAVNNFHLLSHFLARPARYWAAPEMAVAWNKYRMWVVEGLCGGEGMPPAWKGFYAATCFRAACALFGCGKKEEGYEYLERAFRIFPEWDSILDGAELEVGDPLIFGGIRAMKGKRIIKLPDGTRESISYCQLFEDNAWLAYHGLTASHGWEWFNAVRGEEKFQAYIQRAREWMG